MNAATLVNQTCGKVEYYTPAPIVEAARRCMFGIHLDPASSSQANQVVKAHNIFTVRQNGLAQPWAGGVWMNHPFGRAEKACGPHCAKEHEHHSYDLHGNAAWVNKLELEFNERRVSVACCITFACTSETWFQPLLRRPQCYLVPRTNYLTADGSVLKGVTKGSVVTYFGSEIERFSREFREFGVIKI